MPTNKVQLRSIEETMSDYTPIYQPIYPLLLGKSQAYSEEVGNIDFKRVSTVGDIRARQVTPKDTEIRQIAVGESKKSFKKYFLANQFTLSALQDREGVEDVVAQVLDEHQKQMDEIILLGEGTSNGTVLNNGLFWSGDANHVTESAGADIATGDSGLVDMHGRVMSNVADADDLSGRKLILFYGDASKKLGSLYSASNSPFKGVLEESLGANYSVAKIPKAITPASSHGWIVVNLDQVKLHYTALPSLKAQGVNEEKMYAWFNFLMGSAMVEVLAPGAVIRQPVTFA